MVNVPKHHRRKIDKFTNGKCKFEWDNDACRFVVKERRRKPVRVTLKDITLWCYETFWYPVFTVVTPDGKFTLPSDFVYEELWKKDKNNYLRGDKDRIIKGVNDRNRERESKKKEMMREMISKDIDNSIVKGRRYFT